MKAGSRRGWKSVNPTPEMDEPLPAPPPPISPGDPQTAGVTRWIKDKATSYWRDADRLKGIDLGDGIDWETCYRTVAKELERCADQIGDEPAAPAADETDHRNITGQLTIEETP